MSLVYPTFIWYNSSTLDRVTVQEGFESMKKEKKLNLPPHHPKIVAAVLEDFRTMPSDELLALLNRRPEGVEETNMNEELAEYYRKLAGQNAMHVDKREEAA
jgi:hypothetical protein